MRGAAELTIVASSSATAGERGGCIGKVQAVVQEHPGLTTREITALVREPSWRVSGALNKLKLEGVITAQDFRAPKLRWVPVGVEAPPPQGLRVDATCRCGTWILFGSLATPEERARPRCALFPFADRGAP